LGFIAVHDDAIWATNVEGDPSLGERIRALAPGEMIDLEVDGIVGKWQRMRTGRDGRPAYGIRPIGDMQDVWARLRRQGKTTVAIREVAPADSYLAALAPTLSEWDSAEDEAAYGDL